MRLEEIYQSPDPVISFEVFPPKSGEEKTEELFRHLHVLKKYNPALISVTYGAGGSSRDKSFEIVNRVKSQLNVTPMPHFTCVCSSREFINDYLIRTQTAGIENILALRGDEPADMDICYRDFRYADELVEFIRNRTSLSVAVAAYPEGHIDSPDLAFDTDCLKRKIDAGAVVLFTQLFFDNRYYFDFMERLAKASIRIPVIPGILPVSSYSQLQRMTKMCGSKIPPDVDRFFGKYRDDEKAVMQAGIEFAVRQTKELLAASVPGLHFYTLNRSQSICKILDNIL